MSKVWRSALWLALIWVASELLGAAIWPSPLDPPLVAVPALAVILGLGLLWGSTAALLALGLRLWEGRRGLAGEGMATALLWSKAWPGAAAGVALAWAAVWLPELCRAAERSPLWSLLALPALLLCRRPRLLVGLSLLGALALPGLRSRGLAPGKAPPGFPLLLISVDTVRADAGLTEGLAERGYAVYPEAISAGPWTLPAMHSLFAGGGPAEHGGGLPLRGGYSQRRPEARSWVLQLQVAGWQTEALICNPHLRRDNGFAQGFDAWQHADEAREKLLLLQLFEGWRHRLGGPLPRSRRLRDTLLVEEALRRLHQGGRRFLWLHLLAPHEYARDVEDPPPGWVPGTRDLGLQRAAYARAVERSRQHILALDEAAGPEAVVAVLADHGEAFSEGPDHGHGHSFSLDELAVPLALRQPGKPGGLRPGLHSTTDLGPALLAAVGIGGAALAPRKEVPVGGLRRGEPRVGRWTAFGFQPDPSPSIGPLEEAPLGLGPRLQALGYAEP
jgi:hypothetical protein